MSQDSRLKRPNVVGFLTGDIYRVGKREAREERGGGLLGRGLLEKTEAARIRLI